MSGKLLTLAVASVAPLLALAAVAQAQDNLTRTCHFTKGPRAGTTVDFSESHGAPRVPVGSHCGDMTGSNGVAVAEHEEGGRLPGLGRFYRSPAAPLGLNESGEAERGYTLGCRFTSGPRAGSVGDFSHVLGATPIRIGDKCSDGASRGVGAEIRR